MKWQRAISTLLDLNTKSKKIICDSTSVLLHESFLAYLRDNGYNYQICKTTGEIIREINTGKATIVLTPHVDIPSFICNQWNCKYFRFQDLPINGNISGLLQSYITNQVIYLLYGVYSTDHHQTVTPDKIPTLIAKGKQIQSLSDLDKIIQLIYSKIQEEPNIESLLNVGVLIGKMNYLSILTDQKLDIELQSQIDEWSTSFIRSNGMEQVFYASTGRKPKSVDKIISHLKSLNTKKLALICFDCMGFTEWQLLKDYLGLTTDNYVESPLFSMIPSVTSISRMAIYFGTRDIYHHKSPGRRAEEKAFLKNFEPDQCLYLTENDLISENTLLGYDKISVLYNLFDELAHSVKFPNEIEDKRPYFNIVRSHLKESTIKKDLNLIKSLGYTMYFCSDHGSIVAKGNGKRVQKYLTDSFAKRAVLIPKDSSELVEYDQISVPFEENLNIVLPEGRTMFANRNTIEVNHGGITLEEIVVPFIELK